jgi:hypothetical protein
MENEIFLGKRFRWKKYHLGVLKQVNFILKVTKESDLEKQEWEKIDYLLELLHTHLGFLFPNFIRCLLVIISHYPVSYILGVNIPPGEYSLSVDTLV